MFLVAAAIAIVLIVAYLCGSIPSAVWIGKRYYNVDIREHGSKNAGTTNMLRVLGKRAALPVFALDYFKGFVGVTLVNTLYYLPDGVNESLLVYVRLAAVFITVLGHIFPIFANFRGGKGVATIVGAITAINPFVILLCFSVWFIIFLIWHYVSLASMIGGCTYPIFTLLFAVRDVNASIPNIVFSFIVAGLLVWTHRKNIGRLKEGTESKIYVWRRPEQKDKEQPLEEVVDDVIGD